MAVACAFVCHGAWGGEPNSIAGGAANGGLAPESFVVRVPGTVDDPTLPRTVITPVLHSDDPAPGIPNATIITFTRPAIDGAGNVLFWGQFRRDDESFARSALWYGRPGRLVPIMYDGMPAPHFPPGVEIGEPSSSSCLAENGLLALTVRLRGPGITAGYNDRVIYVGRPGHLLKLLQGGDQAPGTERGTIIDLTLPFGFGAQISDNGVLMVLAFLSGPEVDDTNDRAMWIGPHGDLKLVWREGMIAPGTGGAKFESIDFIRFNDAEQFVFRGRLMHDHEVGFSNDGGNWCGDPDSLALIVRESYPVPEISGAVFVGGSASGLNAKGEITLFGGIAGDDVTAQDNFAVWRGFPGDFHLVVRGGDRSLTPDARIDTLSGNKLSEQGNQELKARLAFADGSTIRGHFIGQGFPGTITLLEGTSVLGSSPWTAYKSLLFGQIALNDLGDSAASAGIGVASDPNDLRGAFIVRVQRSGLTYPLLRTGDRINGREFAADLMSDFDSNAWWDSGGSDGERTGFNDNRQLASKLEFTDGTFGIYIMETPRFGDGNHDGVVDVLDLELFELCRFQSAIGAVAATCALFDADWDDDIDLLDFRVLQVFVSQ